MLEQGRPRWPTVPGAATALVGHLLFAALFYRGGRGIGLLSDAWVVLAVGSRPLPEALTLPIGYHIIPVANLLSAVLWRSFGLFEPAYQVANLLSLALIGWLLFLLGRSLWMQSAEALVGSLLFVGNASFYDLPLWPVIGNIHFLAAGLYLGALLALGAPRPTATVSAGAFAALGSAALLTFELTVTLLPVGLLYLLVARRHPLRQAVLTLAPGSAVAGCIVAWWTTQEIARVEIGDLTQRVYLALGALLNPLTLRGSHDWFSRLFALGRLPSWKDPIFMALLVGWVAGALFAAALVAWRTRSPGVRFLVAWLVTHLAFAASQVSMAPRHLLLGSMPASLLLAQGLFALGGSIDSRLRGARREIRGLATPVVVGLGLVALLTGSQADIARASAQRRGTTRIVRELGQTVRETLRRHPQTTTVIVVDALPYFSEDGLGASLFSNPIRAQLSLCCDIGNRVVRQRWTSAAKPIVPVLPSPELDSAELARLAARPRTVVIRFVPTTREVLVVHADTRSGEPRRAVVGSRMK